MRLRNLIIAIVSGTALAVGIWASVRFMSEPALPTTATVLPGSAALPDFALLDQNGTPVDRHLFEGQWDLVFFGFTSCPDVCPLTLKVLSDAQKRLAETNHEQIPRIVLVSVDPERDTPERMAAYMRAFGDGSVGLTGDLAEIRNLTDGLGIFFEKDDTGSDVYAVNHSSVVIVVDPDGRYRALFSSPHRIENFVHDLPILMAL